LTVVPVRRRVQTVGVRCRPYRPPEGAERGFWSRGNAFSMEDCFRYLDHVMGGGKLWMSEVLSSYGYD